MAATKTKKLYLLRHAKSGHEEYVSNDIERHLSARGYREADEVAATFKKQLLQPELIISSPAIRAFTTAIIFAKHLNYPVKVIELNSSIYEASVQQLLYVINQLSDQLNCVMMVGHNPGFSDLASLLYGKAIDEMPTCGITGITINLESWSLVGTVLGRTK